MLVMVVFFIAFRWIHLSTPLIRLFLLVLILLLMRSEERFSRNAETDLVCRLLLEKKMKKLTTILIYCLYVFRYDFIFHCKFKHRYLHSFPTRRSSDLTPKATSSTLYFDSLTVNAGNGGFLHCIQMDTSVNAANQVVSVGADIAFD